MGSWDRLDCKVSRHILRRASRNSRMADSRSIESCGEWLATILDCFYLLSLCSHTAYTSALGLDCIAGSYRGLRGE